MLYREAIAMAGEYGRYTEKVGTIRCNAQYFSVADLAKFVRISIDKCTSVMDTIKAHPDWNDEQVAEEIYWED